MRTRKIFAGIIATAMLLTSLQLPVITSAAETPSQSICPEIVTDVFGDISNDAEGVIGGTDLSVGDGTYDYTVDMPVSDSTASATTVTDSDGETKDVWKNADKDISYYRRNKILTFVAKSQATDADNRKFVDTTPGSTSGVSAHAVEIAYMDADKNPLKIKDGTSFDMESTTWDKAWLDLSCDVQRTDVVLNTFVDESVDLKDLNDGETSLDRTKITAAQLFATGDFVSFMIYNVIRGEFSGYLRIKVTDNAGMITIQDYPFVADGQYPDITITSTTDKNPEGETTATAHGNTFIADSAFEKAEDVAESSKKISKRVPAVDTDELKEALNAVKDGGKYSNEEHSEYGSYSAQAIWAMGDITVDTLKVTDAKVSSGVKSVTYKVENNPDNIAISGGTLVESGALENTATGNYNIVGTTDKIVITKEGLNILTITAEDNAGLIKTNRYYFFIDTTEPTAEFELVDLEDKVASLFSAADKVTNLEQGIDMSASTDVVNAVSDADIISNIDTTSKKVYQYRLLNKNDAALADTVNEVPAGYELTAPSGTSLTYGTWLEWSLDEETAIIDEEFDGLVQVRVQDRAGNWSKLSVTDDESVIADSTDAVIAVRAYAESDSTEAEILKNQTSGVNDVVDNVTTWINDSAILEISVTDKDLINAIRSSGLDDGAIKVKAKLNGSTTDHVTLLGAKDDGSDFDSTKDADFSGEKQVTDDFFISTDTDKAVKFYIRYEGTGEADISIYVNDKAKNIVDYPENYNVKLRVDKIAPYLEFKAYDATDEAMTDLLSPNSGAATQYEERAMPWGPNTQILKVTVADDNSTDVQSSAETIKISTNKAVKLLASDGTAISSYAAGEHVIPLADCTELENDEYEANPGYEFYIAYEGTGICDISVYVKDAAENERAYPASGSYDARLRVDKIKPEFENVELKETAADVDDSGWSLFSFNKTDVDKTTRKQMKLYFSIKDQTETNEQSGVVVRSELTAAQLKDIAGYADGYNSAGKTHLYNSSYLTFETDDHDEDDDAVIDYILLPVAAGKSYGAGGSADFTTATGSNAEIEAIIAPYIEDGAEWVKGEWKDGEIVIPEEFQGAIVLRTIDRVGNIEYSEPITLIAESSEPVIELLPQNGGIYSQNNYGWSKRDDDYVEIVIKDENDGHVDAWLSNVYIKVEDLSGSPIEATSEFAYELSESRITPDDASLTYAAIDSYTSGTYGYAVISDGKTASGTKYVEEDRYEANDGYIRLGYVRVHENARITVTAFDKAEYNGAEDTGNKLTAEWISRFDRTAPIIDTFDIVTINDGTEDGDNNKFALKLSAHDDLSGLAPEITSAEYNTYTSVSGSYLWQTRDDAGAVIETFNSGLINEGQYEIAGLQYALIPRNDAFNVEAWDFEKDPEEVYDEFGYNGEFGKIQVWHNYIDDKTPVVPSDFDGYIIVRAVDKAGNITICGYSPIIDITANDDWCRDTQFINVKATPRNGGTITDINYFGNNNLLYPANQRRSLSEAMSGEGAFIEVAEEGITNIIVGATEEYSSELSFKQTDWEGKMTVGNVVSGGYSDWSYQLVDVKIDKTAPEFVFYLNDDEVIDDKAVFREQKVKIEARNVVDPTTNKDDEHASHIASGIARVEWCAVQLGSDEESWKPLTKNAEDSYEYYGVIFEELAFNGTIKVRVTDNAGNVTEKSKKVRQDATKALISISKSYEEKCSDKPVEVLVTVSKTREEYSDIKIVTYTLTDEKGNTIGEPSEKLPLTGGVITITREGTTNVEVKAQTTAGLKETAETTVIIHYDGLKMPTIEGVTPNCWTTDNKVTVSYDGTEPVYYSQNGSAWAKLDTDKTITLTNGANNIKLYAKSDECLCESDVNEYNINYDNGTPIITIDRTEEADAAGVITIPSTNSSVVIGVAANKNTCSSEIKSLTYELNGEKKYLNPTGGNIVLTNEGIWNITNITVTMESGITKTFENPIEATIDKTAPDLSGTKLIEREDDAALFSLTNKKQNLYIKVNDTMSTVISVDYAVVEKGAEPEWKSAAMGMATEKTIEKVIDKAFDGSVMVRAKDAAGNEATWTTNITADGIKPEVSISAPSTWQTDDVYVKVDIADQGVSAGIKEIKYSLAMNGTIYKHGSLTGSDGENFAKLNSNGGEIEITAEGTTILTVEVTDAAGNTGRQTATIKIDKTAPEYSRMIELMGLYNSYEIEESDWDIIHDGWTYNHAVSLDGVDDSLSGIKRIDVKFTDGENETSISNVQRSYSFSENGKYEVTMLDNAGNVRTISFAIDKTLKNVMNVVGVDETGRLNIAVTDGGERLTFYSKESSASDYSRMYNGVTDQLWDGKTGVRYIYAQNDSKSKTNTLYIIVASSGEYGVSLTTLTSAPNRYIEIDTAEDVTVIKNAELFNPSANERISSTDGISLNEDGVYTITIE